MFTFTNFLKTAGLIDNVFTVEDANILFKAATYIDLTPEDKLKV